ncbi:ABC transporter substrate-binding protein [Pseudodesulfovibrio sp.]|uniref:ABC transporter substrate-binding protein n=1 Tax=Pseudodesulfovibrio sp. TaxID=2035812 RepID=UPI00260B508A|nr:ABC transporter substrate-binding protein [Pseudodesulfovibrio sp.]MDD3313366.1 ABC transporter substrate-binding protein [Pseudodesulfovibrio sp.]
MKKLVILLILLLCLPVTAQGGRITDDAGTTIDFSAPFTRIISLYPAHTENLFSLGLGESVIGASTSEDFPSEALTKPAFNARDGVEKFLAAGPDLVLIRPMLLRSHPALWEALRRRGITVLALQPSTIDEMYAYWRKLGQLTGREPEAEEMIAEFKAGLEKAASRIDLVPVDKRPGVFFESVHSKYATFTPGSMPLFVLKMAGGRNVADDAKANRDTNIANYGMERVLARGPRIDVYLAQYGHMNEVEVRDITNAPAASSIKAVRDRNVFLVDEHLVSRPTMRLLQGIETVHQLLYPGGVR